MRENSDHYEKETLAALERAAGNPGTGSVTMYFVALAQVHATLAVAAATEEASLA